MSALSAAEELPSALVRDVFVGINGFGRIGRAVFRVVLSQGADTPVRVVAINAPGKSAVRARAAVLPAEVI